MLDDPRHRNPSPTHRPHQRVININVNDHNKMMHEPKLLSTTLAASGQPFPYLFCALDIFVEAIAVRCDFDCSALIALNDAREKIPQERKPQIIAHLAEVVEESAL